MKNPWEYPEEEGFEDKVKREMNMPPWERSCLPPWERPSSQFHNDINQKREWRF